MLPFDLDSASMAAIIIMVASVLDSSLLINGPDWLRKARSILGTLHTNGNELSMLHMSELGQLGRLLTDLDNAQGTTNDGCQDMGSSQSISDRNNQQATYAPTIPLQSSVSSIGEIYPNTVVDAITTSTIGPFMADDIMDLVNSIEGIDKEWMPQTMVDYNIW
jgi:hypothetical protein